MQSRLHHHESECGAAGGSPVVGIWEWELRKGGAKVTGGHTGKILVAETSGFGVLALLESNNGPITATLVPWQAKPFTDEQASEFAEQERVRRKIPKPGKGSGYTEQAGVLHKSWLGGPQVEMLVGMSSRRVLSISIKPAKSTKSPIDDDL